MALELFVQLLEICGIKFEFFSRSNLFPQIAYHSLTLCRSQITKDEETRS